MKKNIISILLSIALLIFSGSLIFAGNRVLAASLATRPNNIAQSNNFQRTAWKVVDDSLTDLLDDGWKIIAQSTYRMALATTGGIGAFDEKSFNYTLNKNNKYITCFIFDPTVKEGASSGCRALN